MADYTPAWVVQVQWDGATWSTVPVQDLSVSHGASPTGNPDRPSILTANGQLTIRGTLTTAMTAGRRFRCRVRVDGSTRWQGWLQEPLIVPDAVPLVSWRVVGEQDAALGTDLVANRAAGTVAAWIADLGATAAEVSARRLKAVAFSGRRGEALSQLGAVASASVIERADGSILFAGNALSSAPSSPVVVSSSAMRVRIPQTEARADRIRNQVTIVSATSGANNRRASGQSILAGSGVRSSEASITVPALSVSLPNAGGVFSDVTVSSVIEVEVPAAIDVARQFGWDAAGVTDWQWLVVAPPTNRPTYSESSGTVSIGSWVMGRTWPGNTPPTQHTQTWRWLVPAFSGTAIVRNDAFAGGPWSTVRDTGDPQSMCRVTMWTNAFPPQSRTFGRQFMRRVRVTHTVTAVETVTRTTEARVNDASSQSLWGVRPLQLPDWIAGNTDLQAQIDALAVLRHEHTVTLPMRQPSSQLSARVAALDAGDYVALNLQDSARNVAIQQYGLVTQRSLRWSADGGGYVTLRCLEVGQPYNP